LKKVLVGGKLGNQRRQVRKKRDEMVLGTDGVPKKKKKKRKRVREAAHLPRVGRERRPQNESPMTIKASRLGREVPRLAGKSPSPKEPSRRQKGPPSPCRVPKGLLRLALLEKNPGDSSFEVEMIGKGKRPRLHVGILVEGEGIRSEKRGSIRGERTCYLADCQRGARRQFLGVRTTRSDDLWSWIRRK